MTTEVYKNYGKNAFIERIYSDLSGRKGLQKMCRMLRGVVEMELHLKLQS